MLNVMCPFRPKRQHSMLAVECWHWMLKRSNQTALISRWHILWICSPTNKALLPPDSGIFVFRNIVPFSQYWWKCALYFVILPVLTAYDRIWVAISSILGIGSNISKYGGTSQHIFVLERYCQYGHSVNVPLQKTLSE